MRLGAAAGGAFAEKAGKSRRGGGGALLRLRRSGAGGVELRRQMERNAALGPVARTDSGLVISVLLLLLALTFHEAAGDGASPPALPALGRERGPAGPCRQRCWFSPCVYTRVRRTHTCACMSTWYRGRVLVAARAAGPGNRRCGGTGTAERGPARCWRRWRCGVARQPPPRGHCDSSNSLKYSLFSVSCLSPYLWNV